MWILTSKKSGEIYYLLPEKPKYSVGRSNTDLILKDDASISRTHACLYPTKECVKIVDVGSKYGTYYNENIENNIAMEKNIQIELKNGERLQFGLLGNEWTLSKLNLCTLISSLNNEQKSELKENLDALNGKMTETWINSCTHLTMPEITVTLKVLRALVENIPIVSCGYWKAYYNNLKNNESPPKCDEYLPRLAETFLNKEIVSFGLNDKRKTIFQGKTFIFMNKKPLDNYQSIICCAGGECKDLNKGMPKSFLIKKNVIVVQHSTSSSSQSQSSQVINMIEDYLKSKNCRIVPDFEIGLAIIYCSTEKYCNPDYKITHGFLQNSSKLMINSCNILAEETPSSRENMNTEDVKNRGLSEIPESVVYNPEQQQSSVEYNVDRNNESEDIRKNEMEVLEYLEDQEEQNDKIFKAHEKNNSNENVMKRKRSSSPVKEENSLRSKKKSHINEDKSPLRDLRKPQQSNSQMITFDNFIDTSSKRKRLSEQESAITNEQTQSTSQKNTRKRGKIAVINDDDDDDDSKDDLFNFGASSSKKQKKAVNDAHERVSEDNFFSFSKNKNNNRTLSTRTAQKQTSSVIPNNQNIHNPSYTKSRSNTTPIQIDPNGWLSKSMNKIKIESPDEIKTEISDIEDKKLKDEKDWIDSLKGCFQVNVRPMQIVSRCSNQNLSVVNTSENSSGNMNTTKKNFKAFVKKQNYKPQNETIPTVPVTLPFNFIC